MFTGKVLNNKFSLKVGGKRSFVVSEKVYFPFIQNEVLNSVNTF